MAGGHDIVKSWETRRERYASGEGRLMSAWYDDVANAGTLGTYGLVTGRGGLAPAKADADIQAQQDALIAQLTARANGTGPSVAGAQMKQATDRLAGQQFAMANSQPGLAPAAGLRMAQAGSANIGAQIAGQAGIARAAEQTQAQGLLAQLLQQQADADMARKQQTRQLYGGLLSAGAGFAATAAGKPPTPAPAPGG